MGNNEKYTHLEAKFILIWQYAETGRTRWKGAHCRWIGHHGPEQHDLQRGSRLPGRHVRSVPRRAGRGVRRGHALEDSFCPDAHYLRCEDNSEDVAYVDRV